MSMFGYLVCRLRGHRPRWLLNLVNPITPLMQESLWQCQRCGRTEKRGGWAPEPDDMHTLAFLELYDAIEEKRDAAPWALDYINRVQAAPQQPAVCSECRQRQPRDGHSACDDCVRAACERLAAIPPVETLAVGPDVAELPPGGPGVTVG